MIRELLPQIEAALPRLRSVLVVPASPPPPAAVYTADRKVVVALRGRHPIDLAMGRRVLPPGGAALFHPGAWHRMVAGPRRTYVSCTLLADRLRWYARHHSGRGDDPGPGEATFVPRPRDPLLDATAAAVTELRGEELVDAVRLLWRCCLRSLGPEAAATDADPRWTAIRAYLEEHAHRHPSRDQVARAVGLHPSTLSALCRRRTGRRFIDLATDIRMRHAAHLLGERGLTVAATAEALGFTDVRHFRRVFRRSTGRRPGELTGRL